MSPEKNTRKSGATAGGADAASSGFSAEEKAAMKERSQELKAEARRGGRSKKDGEADVLAKIAEMPESDRRLAERLHQIVKAEAPDLAAKTWYGMPAYALGGKVVCFFQGAAKFDARYATLGFNDTANLDEGDMWPTAFAVRELTPTVEARVAELVKKAASRGRA